MCSFAAVVATYCGIGTFIKSKLPNHSDACYNNIPQRDFWFDLPSLVSDGAVYAASMGKKRANKKGTYESIGPPALPSVPPRPIATTTARLAEERIDIRQAS